MKKQEKRGSSYTSEVVTKISAAAAVLVCGDVTPVVPHWLQKKGKLAGRWENLV
ncbi:hypothetical protein Nmel_014390 [Mimus melanotis]